MFAWHRTISSWELEIYQLQAGNTQILLIEKVLFKTYIFKCWFGNATKLIKTINNIHTTIYPYIPIYTPTYPNIPRHTATYPQHTPHTPHTPNIPPTPKITPLYSNIPQHSPTYPDIPKLTKTYTNILPHTSTYLNKPKHSNLTYMFGTQTNQVSKRWLDQDFTSKTWVVRVSGLQHSKLLSLPPNFTGLVCFVNCMWMSAYDLRQWAPGRAVVPNG